MNKNSNFKIIFVHGYTASSQADWYPNISSELEKLNVDFAVPDLPGGQNPHAREWLRVIHEVVSKVKKPIVLVGHSLGTRAVLLYLERYRVQVEKVLLIAAFANDTTNAKRHGGKKYPDFFEHKIDIEKIKPLVGKFIVMHSKDDNSIDHKQGFVIAKDLGADLITFKNRGHFSEPENAKYVLEVLRKELSF